MSGQWKPGDGDVAVISWRSQSGRSGGTALALRCSHEYDESHWTTQTFGEIPDHKVTSARPLVVIDPEDAEAVERLLDAYDGKSGGWDKGEYIARLQAALREFARPTPPKCPATLVIGGERLECERDPGHVTDHRNDSIGQGVRWSA